jgi:hypothetical protein
MEQPRECEDPPFAMGPVEEAQWRRFDADRRTGVTTVGSLRDVTGYVWSPGQ